MAMEPAEEERMSIYRVSRSIKRMDNSLYNALRSIYEDSTFVAEIAGLWPELPLLANIRCGLWYSPRFDATCYFKSTDGHTNNWSFSTARLNLHVAQLAGQKGGCIIVDSTRRGKRFPDSMSKTIPIWACVLNRAIKNYMHRTYDESQGYGMMVSDASSSMKFNINDWDCSLHLPVWVPNTENAAIVEHIENWTKLLETCGADIGVLASNIRKPLRPLWISQKTRIWLNEVPYHDSWDFTPLILVSASASDGITQLRTTSEFSWRYISGAGDDEESWARGLSPTQFWEHAFDLIDAGPDVCNKRVADIVEKERVYRAYRGDYSPQVAIKSSKVLSSNVSSCVQELNTSSQFKNSEGSISSMNLKCSSKEQTIFWIGSTSLALGATSHVSSVPVDVDCVLNCDGSNSVSFCSMLPDSYLHLSMVSSKLDRFSLINNLPLAVEFAKLNLSKGKKILICCHNGEDISVCVCLAILTSLFDEQGSFDSGSSAMQSNITKWDMRRRLVFICNFAVNARPSRGNLRQIFGFLCKEKEASLDVVTDQA